MKRQRRGSESGFALLVVMVMAAIIAVMLYREMPRVVFEGQRAKEQLLIQRGEQYYRAIQLFTRQRGTYPPSIEALENTNNIRYLRRRYKDPFSGKDDWRLIHAAPGGIFPDSLTRKPPPLNKDLNKDAKDATANAQASAGQLNPADPNAALARARMRRGASDTSAYGTAGTTSTDPNAQQSEPVYDADPSQQQQQEPNQPVASEGQPEQPQPGRQIYPFGGQQQPGQPVPPGQVYPIGSPAQRGPLPFPIPQPQPNQPGDDAAPPDPNAIQPDPNQEQPFDPDQGETGQVNPPPVPSVSQPVNPGGAIGVSGSIAQPGFRPPPGGGSGGNAPSGGPQGVPVPGVFNPAGSTPGAPTNNDALSAIQQQLMGPRSAGVPGGGQMLGAGIAGVASKHEGEGIRIYKDKTKYTEWEFLYDRNTDSSVGPGAGPRQPGQLNPPPQNRATQ